MGREKTALKSVIINYCPLVCPLFLGLLFFFMQSARGGQEEEIQDRKQVQEDFYLIKDTEICGSMAISSTVFHARMKAATDGTVETGG